ncbi:hypothetical protein BGZ46_007050 [Entomortierella lignicola]|nr:hypothetical protein BGZ46_007050 [Entomortierella lignicola]
MDKGQSPGSQDPGKGYYAAQPPQYPQQSHPAYGQPAYGEAASYQPGYPNQPYGNAPTGYASPQPGYGQQPAPGGYGYPPSHAQGYYPQTPAQGQPVIIQQVRPQQTAADDACLGCCMGATLCCCLEALC